MLLVLLVGLPVMLSGLDSLSAGVIGDGGVNASGAVVL